MFNVQCSMFAFLSMNDLKFALRQLLKNPGSTVLAVLILSLGIGGNTAVWSVLDPTILHPLPAKDSERLVAIREVDALHDQRSNVSPPLFAELSRHTNIFVSLSAFVQNPERPT